MADEPVVARISRRFTASAERVYDAWLDPAMLSRWMFGPQVRDEEILHLKLEAKVGGTFSFLVRRGTDEIDHVGEYLELERPHRLVFTWGIVGHGSSRVVIEIRPLETGCELELSHEMAPEWADFVDRAAQGWTHMLEALARLL